MKKNEIEEVVAGHFKKLDKLFPKIIAGFELGDIHNFRIEIKKLRSFLHLLDMEVDGEPPGKITKKMKTFYGYMGVIRNLQLHIQNINNYFQNSIDVTPELYNTKLRGEIEYWENTTKEFISSHNNFLNDGDKIISELPAKLKKSSIKKFIKYIIYEVQVLLIRLDDDETIHSIRKFLKDLLYNWPYVKYYMVDLSPGLHREEDIREFIEMLGGFRDKCIDLTFLQTYYADSCPEKDKPVLKKVIYEWNIEKENIKKTIRVKLELIPVMPIVSAAFSFKRFRISYR